MSINSALDAAKSNAIAAISAQQKSLSAALVDAQAKVTSFATQLNNLLAQTASTPLTTATVATSSGVEKNVAMSSTVAGASPTLIENNSFFYGYNGQAYSLAPPTGDSFLASNGQTYTKQQILDWYAAPNASGMTNQQTFGADLTMMAQLGMKPPDLYKARYLAGQHDTNGTGIYTDTKEFDQFEIYKRANLHGMDFHEWRAIQEPKYLASLQAGPNENIGWLNGPVGGVPVGGGNANSTTSTLALAALSASASTDAKLSAA